MPLYEYICDACGEHFDRMVRFSELNQQPECPHCHSIETRKQISLFASQSTGGSLNAGNSSCGPSHSGFS